jgi:spore maturation protein SpmB
MKGSSPVLISLLYCTISSPKAGIPVKKRQGTMDMCHQVLHPLVVSLHWDREAAPLVAFLCSMSLRPKPVLGFSHEGRITGMIV